MNLRENGEIFRGVSWLTTKLSQPIATRVDELLSGVKAQVIQLFGPELDVLAAKGQEIEAAIKSVDGARDVALEQIAGEAQLVTNLIGKSYRALDFQLLI